MKRNTKSIILIGLFLALLVSYRMIDGMNQHGDVSEEKGSFALIQRSGDELVGMCWTNGYEECHFEKDDDGWHNANDSAFPTDQEAVQEMADRLISMKASRRLNDVEKPEDYGFSDDSYAVTAEWSDGETTRYVLGDATPFGDGYYLRIEGEDGTIYTSPNSLSAMFAETLTDLAILEELLTVEEPAQLIIGTQLDLTYEKTSISIDPDQHWYATDGGEPMDDESVEELIETIETLAWRELISTSAADAELVEWQLSEEAAAHIILLGGNDERLELLIGTTDDNGAYYSRLSSSSMVYTLSADSIEPILDSDEEQLWNLEIFPLDYSDVQLFTCELDGRTLEFVPVDAAEDAEAEKSEDDAEDSVQDLWNSIRNLTATAQCATAPSGEPLLVISVTNTSGARVQYSIYTYDVNSYQLTTDEGRSLLISADEVDKLIRRLKQ